MRASEGGDGKYTCCLSPVALSTICKKVANGACYNEGNVRVRDSLSLTGAQHHPLWGAHKYAPAGYYLGYWPGHYRTHGAFRRFLKPAFSPAEKYRQNRDASEGRGYTIRPVNRTALRAVYAAGADTWEWSRTPLCTACYFRIVLVINTNEPEDPLFVSCTHKKRNIQVCAALNGIIKIIKAQNLCVFFDKKSSS